MLTSMPRKCAQNTFDLYGSQHEGHAGYGASDLFSQLWSTFFLETALFWTYCLCSHHYLFLSAQGTQERGTPEGACLTLVSACNRTCFGEAKDAAKHSITHRGASSIWSNPSQMSVLQKVRRTSSEPNQQPSGIAIEICRMWKLQKVN